MIRLTRPKLILIISAGLFILALVILLWTREETKKRTMLSRTVPYVPGALSEIGTVNPEFTEYFTDQHLFVSVRRRREIQAELDLPPWVIKRPRFNLLFPRPDPYYSQELLFPLPLDKSEYQYDEIQPVSSPLTETFLSLEQLNQFVVEITEFSASTPVGKAPVDPFSDKIIFNDNSSIKGKIISMDDEKVIFHQEGKHYFVTYLQEEIAQVIPFLTIEEIYEQKAEKVSQDNAGAHYELAQWCLGQGLAEQANDQIRQALAIDETKLDLYLFAAQLYRKRMELKQEVALYEEALASSLINKEIIYIKLGELYDILNLPDKALASFESAVKTYPRYIEGWLKLGGAYHRKGDYNLALKQYRRAREIDPDNPALIYGFGMLAFKKGEFNQAQTELLKVLEKVPEQKSRLINTLGVISVNLQEYPEAIKYFQETIKIDSNIAQHWVNLAFLYLIIQQYDEASLLLNQAAQRDPTSALPYLGQGYLAWLQDKTDEAILAFRAGLKIEPEHYLIHFALAQLYFTQGDRDKAYAGFAKCLKFSPPIIGSLYYLGCLAFQADDFTQAATYFDLYLKKRGKPDMVDYTMAGIIYLGLKQWPAARQLLETAHKINPRYALALNARAYLDFTTGQDKTALEQFEEVLKYAPDDTYARDSLEAIRLAAIQTVWVDNFNRDDSSTIGGGWSEYDERCGIEIELVNQHLQFSGVQRIQEQGLTFLERAVVRDTFLKLEVEMTIEHINKAGCGIYLSFQTTRARQKNPGLLFGIDNNRLVYQISDMAEKAPAQWNVLSDDVSSNLVRLTIARTISLNPNAKAEFKLYLDKACVATLPASKLRGLGRADAWSVGILGYASIKEAWKLIVNKVEIYEKKVEKEQR